MSRATPQLHQALKRRDAHLAAMALAGGANVHAVVDDSGMNAVQWCASCGEPELFALMLAHGGHPDAMTQRKRTALDLTLERSMCYPLMNPKYEKVIEQAVAAGASLGWRGSRNEGLLHRVCNSDSLRLVNLLLDKGLDPNQPDNQGRRPLHVVMNSRSDTKKQTRPICLALVRAGADLEAGDQRGVRPIHLAAMRQKADSVGLLRALGASNHGVPVEDDLEETISRTPLQAAVMLGDAEVMIESLQRHGANARNDVKDALDLAHKNNPVMESLLLSWVAREAAQKSLAATGMQP